MIGEPGVAKVRLLDFSNASFIRECILSPAKFRKEGIACWMIRPEGEFAKVNHPDVVMDLFKTKILFGKRRRRPEKLSLPLHHSLVSGAPHFEVSRIVRSRRVIWKLPR